MGAQGTNQHLQVFVSTYVAPDAVANAEALLPGMTSFIQSVDGVGLATIPAVPYKVAHMNSAGKVYFSNEIIPANSKVNTQAYQAAVQGVKTIAIGAVVVGDQFVIKLNLPDYGGLLSSQDDVNFYGNHTVVTGDTADTVAAALRASLAMAVAKAAVAFVAVTGATNNIIVTGLPQPYEQAKFSGRLVHFNLEVTSPDSAWAAATVTAIPSAGFGTGNRVAEQEEFYAGYNTGYKNRFGDWPTMTNPTLATDVSHTFDAISIIHAPAQNTGSAVETIQRQTVIVYFDLDGTALPV